jgi:hypothetical protein
MPTQKDDKKQLQKERERQWNEKLKRTIHTEDGFIVDGRRTIVPPWKKMIHPSELIGATITEITSHSSFKAAIGEKIINVNCEEDDIEISSIEIDASDNELLTAIRGNYINTEDYYGDENEDEY